MEFTKELINKAKECRTTEEILTLAKKNEIELTEDEAKAFLSEFKEGELADEELDNVSGGSAGCHRNDCEVVYFKSEAEVQYLFNIGDIKECYIHPHLGNDTATVRITERRAKEVENSGWKDQYQFDRISGSPVMYGWMWMDRCRFEK